MNTEAQDHHAATECPNCGAAVSGHFCHQCGQETVLHMPSTREFMHEFIGHYIALEGKLWKSLGLLLFRPGRLTLEYINGRRVRYIQPLRLYLTLSVIFFAVMQYGGHESGIDVGTGATKPVPAAVKPGRQAAPDEAGDEDDKENAKAKAGAAASASAAASAATQDLPGAKSELVHEDQPGEIREGTHKLRSFVGSYNQHWADKLGQFSDMSREERNQLINEAFYHYVPYAVFFMMPLFALYLKMLYLGSGRRYGEHLLFALHTNGFAYLMFTLVLLVPRGLHLGVLDWVLWLWVLFYLPMAMRRVYGGSRFVTGLRWIVLMFLHLLTMTLAIVGAVAFGIVH